jgi:hypothetical protein
MIRANMLKESDSDQIPEMNLKPFRILMNIYFICNNYYLNQTILLRVEV